MCLWDKISPPGNERKSFFETGEQLTICENNLFSDEQQRMASVKDPDPFSEKSVELTDYDDRGEFEGWVKRHSVEHGAHFYVNEDTGESRWEGEF